MKPSHKDLLKIEKHTGYSDLGLVHTHEGVTPSILKVQARSMHLAGFGHSKNVVGNNTQHAGVSDK